MNKYAIMMQGGEDAPPQNKYLLITKNTKYDIQQNR